MKFAPQDEIGPYRILRLLGQGGMGAVYEVEHVKLGVHYALKTFILEEGHAELFRKRFLAEGKLLARLDHPHIARVFDLDILSVNGEEFAYFVMDLVHYKDGASYTLADVEVGGADEEHLVRWFSQLASAIDYIHDVGVVHRDIKLNNILLNDKGGVTLGDFGISKFTGERIRNEVDVSRTLVSPTGGECTGNLIMGTAGYMSPEILKGESASAASDAYALGVTFFRLLTGIWYEPGTNVLRLLEPFDGIWSEILPRMLDEDPRRRPARLKPLADRLERAVSFADVASQAATKAVPARRRNGRRLAVRVAASAVGVLLAAGLGFGAYRLWRGTPSVPTGLDHLYDIPACIE